MDEDKKLTGYPSIDKPWLKYYSEEQINAVLPECSLYDYLWDCNKDHLDYYAINYFGHKITFKKLFEMIDETAKAFISIGVNEREIVPIVSVSTVTSVVCFYALNKIGAVSDFINVLSEEKDFIFLFKEVNAKTVVTLDLFEPKVIAASKMSGVKTVVTFGINKEMPMMVNIGYMLKMTGKLPRNPHQNNVISWNDFIKQGKGIKVSSRYKNPDEMCLLTHTGGTTGEPKAVMLSDKGMNAVANYYKQCFTHIRGEIWANVMIPFVVYGILNCLHMPLTLGLTTVIIPKFDGKEWKKYLKKYSINYILAVPSYVDVFYENEDYKDLDLNCLKLCGVGGDGMTVDKEERLNAFFSSHGANIEVLKGYGMTEVCATAVTGLVGINKLGSVGIPLIHNNVMIYDSEKESELSYKEIGEICLQSPSRMIGYLKDEAATESLFKIHPDGTTWLHTGDLGYMDSDGFLFLAGRIKRVILTTKDGVAYKVFPNIPESIIESHDSVSQSCIVGVKQGENQVLQAHIVISDLSNADQVESELRELCDKELPSYSRPTFYSFHKSLPLTTAGKVDYRALEKLAEEESNV